MNPATFFDWCMATRARRRLTIILGYFAIAMMVALLVAATIYGGQ